MKKAVLHPRMLSGTVTPPPSKSAAHRAVICAGLSGGPGRVSPVEASEDLGATVSVLETLGARLRFDGGGVVCLGPGDFSGPPRTADCRESGSTLRFLIPIAAALGLAVTFTGRGRLPRRPLSVYRQLLPAHGADCAGENGLPLTVTGRLWPGTYRLPGDVSSQFITGLLLALPLLPEESAVVLTSPLESAGYLDLTVHILREYGVLIERTPEGFRVPGGQRFAARDFTVEPDWSQAAFWLGAGAMGGEIRCRGLERDSAQGDRAILPLLRSFGARAEWENGELHASGGQLRGIDIDVSQVPDLVPILCVLGCAARGTTRILRASRLRLKESDRLRAMAEGLAALGGDVTELPDGLVIRGTGGLRGGQADSFGDHRIAMALAAASCVCAGPVTVTGCESVRKSYPDFFTVFRQLGGCADVIDLG